MVLSSHRYTFGDMIYDGDWRRRLQVTLALVKEGTSSRDILDAVEHLEETIRRHDERRTDLPDTPFTNTAPGMR